MRSMLVLCWCIFVTSVSLSDDKPAQRRPFHSELGMTFVRVPAGSFVMGNNQTATEMKSSGLPLPDGADVSNEGPAHQVFVSSFGMLTTEVTRGQFAAFVKATGYMSQAEQDGSGGYGYDHKSQTARQQPQYSWRKTGYPQSDNHPVVNVSWNDANAFCNWLTQQAADRAEGWHYQLPTEAQWEYAARAGTRTRYVSGDDPLSLHEFGNVQDASFEMEFTTIDFEKNPGFGFIDNHVFTAVCGSYRPNAFGLYDMHGNVWEWCRDRYDSHYYQHSPMNDPTGPTEGQSRVLRGGSWNDAPFFVRSAYRVSRPDDGRCNLAGFRVVLETHRESDKAGQSPPVTAGGN